MRNVHACLVHDNPDVVADLVRNLAYLDPESEILLYNGGQNPNLIPRDLRVAGRPVLAHPRPRPLRWGRLHDFAFDCMRFALETTGFDTLTIVDSDQLGTRSGYSTSLSAFLAERPSVGMLGTSGVPEPHNAARGPAAAAVRELALWQPLLRRFSGGESTFPYWTFWPGTVFTRRAAEDVVTLVDGDRELATILEHTSIWATEEVVLPTLVALLGHEVAVNPCSDNFVKYRFTYTAQHVTVAMSRPDVFWIHPIPRRYDNPLRELVRSRLNHYAPQPPMPAPEPEDLLLRAPILGEMRRIDGWLSEPEADLLMAATTRALTALDPPRTIVEVGSFCGRATVVLARSAMALDQDAKVYAIDPHDGRVGAVGGRMQALAPTLERFSANVTRAGVAHRIVTVVKQSHETVWDQPISLLVVDHLHDYASVARDFHHFEPWLVEGGLIAFHDYADYFPDVQSFVHELLATPVYESVARIDSLHVLRALGPRVPGTNLDVHHPYVPVRVTVEAEPDLEGPAITIQVADRPPRPAREVLPDPPVVSCLMPTYGRPDFARRAIEYFVRQDLTESELIVIDDSLEPLEPLEHLVLADPRVRVIRLEQRQTIGAKRNLGADLARADLLANWDDDDWYAPWRLSYQVEQISRSGSDVCGLDRLLYVDLADDRAWRYIAAASLRAWLADPTLLFTRELWKRNPFPDTSMGIDCRFLWQGVTKRMLALDREEFYVGLIHRGNTSPKDTRQRVWHPLPRETIDALVGDDLKQRPSGV